MKIKVLCLLITFFCNSLYSQYWVEQSSGVTVQLTSVSAVGNAVWVCGYSGTVLRTTNGGTNWLNVSGGGIPATVQLINVWAVSQTEALVAGYLGTDTWTWRTTNAGANWIQVFTQPGGFINGIVMRKDNPALGFMTGDPVGGRWSLWKTTNSGASWDSAGMYLQQAGTEAGWNNSIYIGSQGLYIFNDSLLWFGTNNSRVYYSSNYGVTWTSQSTAPEVNTYAIGFLIGFGGDGLTGGTNLMKTSNLGINWNSQASVGAGNFSGFVLFPAPVDNPMAGYCWYTRNTTSIYRGMNGQSWAIEYTAPAGNYRHFAQTRSGTVCWGVRSNGGITRANYSFTGVNQPGTGIPSNFSLSQNYPNPFNPNTKIEFQISSFGFVKLIVFDALGREVATIVSQQLSPGTYKADFDSGSLPSGVYYYRLEAGEFTETKKMVLIK